MRDRCGLMLPLDKDPADGLHYSFELWVDTAGNIQKSDSFGSPTNNRSVIY